jgi:hypothetical protein
VLGCGFAGYTAELANSNNHELMHAAIRAHSLRAILR